MNWSRTLAALGMGCLILAPLAQAQEPAAAPATQPKTKNQAVGNALSGNDLPGPIDSLQDVQDTGKMLFKLADTNLDGQISQKEAIDAANLVVGGFFFRADQDGDGIVTREEAQAARDSLLKQKPWLKFVVERAKATRTKRAAGDQAEKTAQQNPVQGLANLLDANNDQKLQASEVRQAVQTVVQGLFAAADTNRDNQMSPTEINAAIIGAARSASQASFQMADADKSGTLSKDEWVKALTEPAHIAFDILDADADGQLSQKELDKARRVVFSQLGKLQVAEPANSLGNLIRSGQTPEQVAPVPSFGTARPAPAPAPPR
ncbi:MAG: hypothetical protein ABI353_23675 [Isosphaeraceae bacterium]